MNEFKVGDLVQLKSGGPAMTVDHFEIGTPDLINCAWFDGKTHNMKAFPKATLQFAMKQL